MYAAQQTRVAALAGLAEHHPAYDSDIQRRLDELLPQLKEALPPAELRAALKGGKSLDLDTVVGESLEEFAGGIVMPPRNPAHAPLPFAGQTGS